MMKVLNQFVMSSGNLTLVCLQDLINRIIFVNDIIIWLERTFNVGTLVLKHFYK
jgi:hypothetical protein